MPILSPLYKISADFLQKSSQVFGLLITSANQLNSMVTDLINLDNQSLEDWLNSQSIVDISALFTAHAQIGINLNNAILIAADQLEKSGISVNYTTVDIRPFQEKILTTKRTVEFIEGKFTVKDIEELVNQELILEQ
jgi:hypothetical protein